MEVKDVSTSCIYTFGDVTRLHCLVRQPKGPFSHKNNPIVNLSKTSLACQESS